MLALRADFNAPPLPQHEKRPHRISAAEWQAGVTYQNERYRILLNGEPQTLAFAASESKGWVMIFAEREQARLPPHPPRRPDDEPAHRRRGHVQEAHRLRPDR